MRENHENRDTREITDMSQDSFVFCDIVLVVHIQPGSSSILKRERHDHSYLCYILRYVFDRRSWLKLERANAVLPVYCDVSTP